MYGFALIAVLAVTGGLIAFIGDKLGTKVGKRKMSIFGLRPKHTSIIVTIITGILISTTTLGVLSLVSRDVRTALFGMEALKAQLTELSTAVATKNKELEDNRAALLAKNAEAAALDEKIQATTLKLQTLSRELQEVLAERELTAAALAVAQQELSASRGEIERLQAVKEVLDSKVKALSAEKQTLQTDVDQLTALNDKLRRSIQLVREGSIILKAGQVLATTVLPPAESKEQMGGYVQDVIYRTNRDVIDKLGIDNKELEVVWVAKDNFDEAVKVLYEGRQDYVLRLTAAGNIVYGEPILAKLEVYPNRMVYQQGDIIYMTVLDVDKDSQSAENIVMTFLQHVNAAAIQQGVLPDPLEGTVGAMSGEEFYEAVNKVKRGNGKVRLAATAIQETHAAGPLKIHLHVAETN